MFCQECNKPKTICQDTTPTPCECPVRDLSTDCVKYTADESTCSGIPSGVTLTEYLEQLDTFICNALEEINTGINLINVGTGLGLYKGIDVLGRREIKSLITNSNILTLTANTNDITFGIDEEALDTFIEENQKTYSVANVGTDPLRVNAYKDSTIVGDNTQFNFRSLTSTGGSITITQELDSINLEVDVEPTTICLTSEDNSIRVTTTEKGCIDLSVRQYCLESKGNSVYIEYNEETNCTNLEAKLYIDAGQSIDINGQGTDVNPYTISVENLQKTISIFPYTLSDNDDKYTIFVDNTISDVEIIIPGGLVDNFSCVFVQMGSGEVTINTLPANDLYFPATLKNIVKGQYYWAMIERRQNTGEFYLLGSLKSV